MNEKEVIDILESDIVIYTAAIHYNVARSAANNEPPRIIYIHDFIQDVSKKIVNSFDESLLTKKSVLHLAHWFIEGMIREQYSKLVNKN